MIYELKHQFRIESARFLPQLPAGHPCRNMHGHSFLITILMRSRELDNKVGWLMDFNEVSKRVRKVLDPLDHKVLNEIPGLENPTSEHLARYLFERLEPQLPGLQRVFVKETLDTEVSFGN